MGEATDGGGAASTHPLQKVLNEFETYFARLDMSTVCFEASYTGYLVWSKSHFVANGPGQGKRTCHGVKLFGFAGGLVRFDDCLVGLAPPLCSLACVFCSTPEVMKLSACQLSVPRSLPHPLFWWLLGVTMASTLCAFLILASWSSWKKRKKTH